MKLLKIDDVNDTGALLGAISEVWDQLTELLEEIFPEMEEDDWDGVKVKELVPIILGVLKMSFKALSAIPGDEKN